MMEPVVPEVLDDTIDFVSGAVIDGPGGKDFDVARKLLTLGALLCEEAITPEQAATSADGTIFEKHVEYKVGNGELEDADGTDAVADRKASAFVSTCRTFIAEAVESGCEAVGTWIGTHLGSPTLGYTIGSAVGHFLNKPVKEIAARGARKIVTYARKTWQWATNAVRSLFSAVGAVANRMFS